MTALGITAWVTRRKWTLGPGYVNNSQVIETLPGPCHWGPSLGASATHWPVFTCYPSPASVTSWPLPETRDTEMVTPIPGDQVSSVIGGETITVFVTIILHTNVYCSDVGLERQRTNRGGECGQCPGPGHGTDDHRSQLRSAWERGSDHVVTSYGGSSGDYQWPVSSTLLIQTFPNSQPPPIATGNGLYGTHVVWRSIEI